MLKHWTRNRKRITIVGAGVLAVTCAVAAIPLNRTIQKAKESVLHEDLRFMRDAIDQYTLDKNKAPQTLQDLVSANYLKEIPKDPMTGSNQTWRTVQEDKLIAVDQKEPGIDDVHSGSHQKALNGTTFDTW